ncbi:MAG: hypothetical protein WCV91_05680, partial [Candidatus Margulisiibacteriota bacterium]
LRRAEIGKANSPASSAPAKARRPYTKRSSPVETPEAKKERLFTMAKSSLETGDIDGARLILEAILKLPGEKEQIIGYLKRRRQNILLSSVVPKVYLKSIFMFAELLSPEDHQSTAILCGQLTAYYNSATPIATNRSAFEKAKRRLLQRAALVGFIQLPEHRNLALEAIRQADIPIPGLEREFNVGGLISGPADYIVFRGLSELRIAAGIDPDPETALAIIAKMKAEGTEARI